MTPTPALEKIAPEKLSAPAAKNEPFVNTGTPVHMCIQCGAVRVEKLGDVCGLVCQGIMDNREAFVVSSARRKLVFARFATVAVILILSVIAARIIFD